MSNSYMSPTPNSVSLKENRGTNLAQRFLTSVGEVTVTGEVNLGLIDPRDADRLRNLPDRLRRRGAGAVLAAGLFATSIAGIVGLKHIDFSDSSPRKGDVDVQLEHCLDSVPTNIPYAAQQQLQDSCRNE